MTEERIARLNELARKSKTIGLTEEEKQEQALLRQEYLAAIRQSLEAQLDNVYIVEKGWHPDQAEEKRSRAPCPNTRANRRPAFCTAALPPNIRRKHYHAQYVRQRSPSGTGDQKHPGGQAL